MEGDSGALNLRRGAVARAGGGWAATASGLGLLDRACWRVALWWPEQAAAVDPARSLGIPAMRESGEYGVSWIERREPCLRVGAGICRRRRSRGSLCPEVVACDSTVDIDSVTASGRQGPSACQSRRCG